MIGDVCVVYVQIAVKDWKWLWKVGGLGTSSTCRMLRLRQNGRNRTDTHGGEFIACRRRPDGRPSIGRWELDADVEGGYPDTSVAAGHSWSRREEWIA